MATTIYFAAQGDSTLSVVVEESVDEVFQALTAAAGLPFSAKESPNGSKVWINPATVAYWEEKPSRSADFT